jgi:tetratricopeptide (TPR) repeat protein
VTRGLLVALACLSVSTILGAPVAAGEARRAMDEGLALFAAKNYEGAARRFEEAAKKAGEEGLDPATPRYNQASALVKAGKGLEAAAAFAEALRSSDPGLRQRAHYNRGIALATAAEALDVQGDTAKAIAILDQALEAYESAMRADPEDEDPKVNHELAFRKKAQLEEHMKEQAQSRGEETRPPRQAGDRERMQLGTEKEMTADEARMMLEAMRQQEISRRSQVRLSRGVRATVDRDW